MAITGASHRVIAAAYLQSHSEDPCIVATAAAIF